MPWPTLVAALACALATAAAGPWVLRVLPEPEPALADGKPPYASLATAPFVAALSLTSFLGGWVAAAGTPAHQWLAWSSLATVGVLAGGIDARTTWLPLPLAHAGWALAAAGALVAAVGSRTVLPVLAALGGAVALGGLFHLLWRVTGAFGYGDVRLAATIGAVTALDSVALVAWSLVLGTTAGAAIGVAHRLAGRSGAFPYGPGLLAGPFLALLVRQVAG